MTATDELRKLLDERGVRWTSKPTHPETTWAHDGWWYNAKFEPWSDSTFKVIIYDLTPEQAVAATLGAGECEVVGSYYYDDYDQYEFEFSCGHSVNMYDKEPPNYCPSCGKAVKR